jgi:hypothetical protein
MVLHKATWTMMALKHSLLMKEGLQYDEYCLLIQAFGGVVVEWKTRIEVLAEHRSYYSTSKLTVGKISLRYNSIVRMKTATISLLVLQRSSRSVHGIAVKIQRE